MRGLLGVESPRLTGRCRRCFVWEQDAADELVVLQNRSVESVVFDGLVLIGSHLLRKFLGSDSDTRRLLEEVVVDCILVREDEKATPAVEVWSFVDSPQMQPLKGC